MSMRNCIPDFLTKRLHILARATFHALRNTWNPHKIILNDFLKDVPNLQIYI